MVKENVLVENSHKFIYVKSSVRIRQLGELWDVCRFVKYCNVSFVDTIIGLLTIHFNNAFDKGDYTITCSTA